MTNPPTNSPVDAYIAALPPLRAARIAAVRAMAHAAFADLDERIEWKMPVFQRRGSDRWIAVASQKSYVSVYLRCMPMAAEVIATDPKLKGGKGCVNITDKANWPEAALAKAVAVALAQD